jgi:hypothetical protein
MANLTLLANMDLIKFAVIIAMMVIWGLSHIVKYLQESAEDRKRREALAQRRQQQQPQASDRAAPEIVAIPGGGGNELEKFLSAMQSAAPARPTPPPIPEPPRPRAQQPKKQKQAKQKDRGRQPAPPPNAPVSQRHLQSQLGTLHSTLENKHVGGSLASSRRTMPSTPAAAEPTAPNNLAGLLGERTIAQTLIAGEVFGPPLSLRDGPSRF